MPLELHNPHSVLAVLETRPLDVLELRTGRPPLSPAWSEVLAQAARHGVAVVRGGSARSGGRRSKHAAHEGGRSGQTSALVKERSAALLDEVLAHAAGDRSPQPVWLALDCIQDPHNVGAIFRTAAFFGIRGAIVTLDRSAPLNATVYDVASGGMEFVPFTVQTNLARALQQAKERGVWILGASEHAQKTVAEVPRDRPWVLVLGNEEKGLRRLTLKSCDELCRIPSRGRVSSLNVSVAAGVLMAELTGCGG